MQTQWGCYWRDGCRKCPDLADHRAFWTDREKTLCFSASLCLAFFNLRGVMELWTWLQRRSLKSKAYNSVCILGRRKKTHEELQTQLVTIQPERDMRSRQRAYKKWKKGANMENCILQVRKYGEKVRSVKSWSVLHLVKEIKTHCKIFFSHINK